MKLLTKRQRAANSHLEDKSRSMVLGLAVTSFSIPVVEYFSGIGLLGVSGAGLPLPSPGVGAALAELYRSSGFWSVADAPPERVTMYFPTTAPESPWAVERL